MDESLFMVTRITWASVGSVNTAVSEMGFKLNQPRVARFLLGATLLYAVLGSENDHSYDGAI